MKSKEYAELFKKTPHAGIDEIIENIPEYANPLHKNQWIATFLKNIPKDIKEKIEKPLKEKLKPKSKF